MLNLKRLFILLLLFSGCYLSALNENPRVAQFPFRSIGPIDGDVTRLLEETMLGELSSSPYVEIKELWNAEIEKEVELYEMGFIRENLISLGKEHNVDFFLTGALGYMDYQFILFYQVYSALDGTCIMARRVSAPLSNLISAVNELSDEISMELYWIFSVDEKQYINSLISLELYDKAHLFADAKKHVQYSDDLLLLVKDIIVAEKKKLFSDFYEALDSQNMEQAFFILKDINTRYGDKNIGEKALEAYFEQMEDTELFVFEKARQELDERLENSDYFSLNEYWESYQEQFINQTSLKDITELEKAVRLREENHLIAQGDRALSELNDSSLIFHQRIEKTFKAQRAYLQAFLVNRNPKILDKLEQTIKIRNALYGQQDSSSNFYSNGLREPYYINLSIQGTGFLDPNYSLGGLNSMAPGINVDFSRIIAVTKKDGLLLGLGISATKSSFTSIHNLTEYRVDAVQALSMAELAYYRNWRYLDLWIGPTIAMGYRSLDMEQARGADFYGDVINQWVLGGGIHFGGALNWSERMGLQMKIGLLRIYGDRGGFLPQNSIELGLRYGFSL